MSEVPLPSSARAEVDLPPRPRPPLTWSDRWRGLAGGAVDRLRWFGVARAIGAALCIVAAGIGSFWLVRTPSPPIEASLPMATVSPTSSADAGDEGGTAAAAWVPTADDPSTATPASTLAATSTSAADIVVHVAGAVALPGVYRLPAGARVVDALAAAGGPAADADTDAVNLAEVLRDGDRVTVPTTGDAVVVPPGVSGSGGGTGPSASTTPAGPVDLNRADAAALDALPGVGPATAAAIVSYRDQHGPFASVDDLADVRGIGPAKLEALRGLVTV